MATIKLDSLGSNVTLLHLPVATVMFSYKTPVAAYVSGRGYVRTAEKFSKTTTKHINVWAGTNAEVIPQSEIESLLEIAV